MLRALTVIFVVIGILFVGWSLLVMTGGRDWLVATMTEETAPAEVAAKPKEAEPAAKPAETEPAEPKPAETAQANPEEPKPEESKPDATTNAEPEQTAAEGTGAPASAENAEGEGDTEDAAKPAESGGGEAASVDPAGNPTETAKSAEKGSLTNPYRDNYEEVAEEGHKKYMAAGCNGCHGGTGGGGMGPPLSNPVWVYGNDGDTLFRLIALGTNGLQEQGFTRKGSENVVGPMPPHGNIVKSNDDMWKIIAWIWSINPPDKSASAAD